MYFVTTLAQTSPLSFMGPATTCFVLCIISWQHNRQQGRQVLQCAPGSLPAPKLGFLPMQLGCGKGWCGTRPPPDTILTLLRCVYAHPVPGNTHRADRLFIWKKTKS